MPFPCDSPVPLLVWAVLLSVVGIALVGLAVAFVRLAFVSRRDAGGWLGPTVIAVLADLVLAQQLIFVAWNVYASEVIGAQPIPSSHLCGGASALLIVTLGILIGQPGVWALAGGLALLALNWLLWRSLARAPSPPSVGLARTRRVLLALIGLGVVVLLEVLWCIGIVLIGGGVGAIPWLSAAVLTGGTLEVVAGIIWVPRAVTGWRFPRGAAICALAALFAVVALGGLAAWFVGSPDTVTVAVLQYNGDTALVYPPPSGAGVTQVYLRTFHSSAVAVTVQAIVTSVAISPVGAVYSCPAGGPDPTDVYAVELEHLGIPVETAWSAATECEFWIQDGFAARCCASSATWQALYQAAGAPPPPGPMP